MKFFLLALFFIGTLYANIGEVTSVSGEVSLFRDDVSHSVKRGSKVFRRDFIKTAKSSKAQIILNDETIITIGPKSEYHFLEYSDGENPKAEMQLKRGFFKVVTGKIGKIAPNRFKIKTQAATIGVRGTQFMAYVSSDEEYIACIYGTIIVYTAKNTYLVPAGKMLVYSDGEWSRQDIDFKFFNPVMLGLDLYQRQLGKTPYFIYVLDNKLAEEQASAERNQPDDPDEPEEAFDVSANQTDGQGEAFHLQDGAVIPVIGGQTDHFEVSSDLDAQAVENFDVQDDISTPIVVAPREPFDVRSNMNEGEAEAFQVQDDISTPIVVTPEALDIYSDLTEADLEQFQIVDDISAPIIVTPETFNVSSNLNDHDPLAFQPLDDILVPVIVAPAQPFDISSDINGPILTPYTP